MRDSLRGHACSSEINIHTGPVRLQGLFQEWLQLSETSNEEVSPVLRTWLDQTPQVRSLLKEIVEPLHPNLQAFLVTCKCQPILLFTAWGNPATGNVERRQRAIATGTGEFPRRQAKGKGSDLCTARVQFQA